MAYTLITERNCRWNATLGRKEWRRLGSGTLPVGGDEPDLPLSVTLVPSLTPAPSGATVTLTATATNGAGPYSYVFTQISGVTAPLSGTGATRAFTMPAASQVTFRVVATDAELTNAQAECSVTRSLTASLTANPATMTTATTVVLTAVGTGGTPGYTYIFVQTGGTSVVMSGSGATRSFLSPSTATTMTFRVTITDAASVSQQATTSATVNPSSTLPAGLEPYRVYVGMATPAEGGNYVPGWEEAQDIIGQPIYEGRRFIGNWISANAFNNMIDQCLSANAYPVISFKVPGTDWIGVANGNYDADLIDLYNLAVTQRGLGNTFACSFHHEPASDGPLADWAAMNLYCAWFFGGRRGGTAASPYNAAHDVTNVMAWAPIGNGFWWRNTTVGTTDGNTAWPQSVIDALRINRGLILNDFYDIDYIDPARALTDAAYRIPATSGVRTWKRIENFMVWARAHNAGYVGCGEFGVIDGPEMDRCAAEMFSHRDKWIVSNYFNSGANSDHEWRLIPSDYEGGQNPTDPNPDKALVDLGGNAQSQGRLDRFKVMLTASTSDANTGPL